METREFYCLHYIRCAYGRRYLRYHNYTEYSNPDRYSNPAKNSLVGSRLFSNGNNSIKYIVILIKNCLQ